jgi:hypothetical protein
LAAALLLLAPALAGCSVLSAQDPGRGARTPSEVRAGPGGLTVDGKPFTVRGVLYDPAPPGADPNATVQPWDWTAHPDAYDKDFRLLKRMGANTIRLARAPPDCPALLRALDAADAYDLKVILGIRGPWNADLSDALVHGRARGEAGKLVGCAWSHRAVLLWMMGDDVPGHAPRGNATAWFALLDEIARDARRIDAHHPVGTAQGLDDLDLLIARAPQVDVLGALALPAPADPAGWLAQADAMWPNRAVVVAAFGADAWDAARSREAGDAQAAAVVATWESIASAARARKGIAGGVVAEWTDGWWRAGNAARHDRDGEPSVEYLGLARVNATYPLARDLRPAYATLRAAWGSDPTGPAPSITNLRGIANRSHVRVLADVTSFGGEPVDVKLRYRVNSGEWAQRAMWKAANNATYSLELGPYQGVAVVFFQVVAKDALNRTRLSEESAARVAAGSTFVDQLLRPVAEFFDGLGHWFGERLSGGSPAPAPQQTPPSWATAPPEPTHALIAGRWAPG